MRGAGLRPNPLKAMTDDLIAMKNENKHDSVEDSRDSKVQNQEHCGLNKVDEDDNGMGMDEEEEADKDTEDDEEEDDEDTDEKGEEEVEEEDEDEEDEDEEEDDDDVESEGETEDGTILSHDDILNITAPCHRDESVAHVEILAQQPRASSSLNNNDEVRIAVQAQDLKVLPSKSCLHITGRLTKANGIAVAATTRLVNNGICFLSDELRYELNGVEIDRCRDAGLTSLMKGYASLTSSKAYSLENAGWYDAHETGRQTDANGYFDVNIPLKMLLGFFEDYNKFVVNAKHELILRLANTDNNAIIQTEAEEYKISLIKVEWLLPHVRVADHIKIPLLNLIKEDKTLTLPFRTWTLYEYPMLPTTTRHVWAVKTFPVLEKPRFVILGFQTNRQNKKKMPATLIMPNFAM